MRPCWKSMVDVSKHFPARLTAILFLALLASRSSHAQSATKIRIDASQPFVEPGPATYNAGSSRSPNGDVLGLNSRYLTLNEKPWLPVMGEFHFSRYPEAEWEDELLKMKAAGVTIVATYVIWIHHEEVEGHFDWQGQRDLRRFTELCARHHLYVVARIGPWDHGEVRNGGFPDWVVSKSPTRVNNPIYLSEVGAWYAQVGEQLKGLLWKDGGSVVGVQIENEYAKRGPGAGEEHILELKKMAIASGFDVPFYFVTGWDNAVIPAGAVLPLYGGYPDAPWEASLGKLAPEEVYAFRFQSRVGGDVKVSGAETPAPASVPFLTAEVGGGNEVTYHRRPVIEPDDIAAMFPVMLGSGVNLYGTYMFQGGENPDGALTTLEETQETGDPNDLPIKSYDFQAPLSEFGQERPSLRKMKVFQYFLNDFGDVLAPMAAHAPAVVPRDPADFTVPRASVRSKGNSGFIFMNNYVRGYPMPARAAVQFKIELPGGQVTVPHNPVDIPSGAYFIWPFNLRLDGVNLRYSTAQVFARLDNKDTDTVYFEAVRGIAPEFVFESASARSVHASNGKVENQPGVVSVSEIKAGVNAHIDLVSSDGRKLRIVVLTADEAEDAWKVRANGLDHLLISAQDFLADAEATPERVCLRSLGSPRFAFTITPPPAAKPASNLLLTEVAADDQFASFSAQAQPRRFDLEFHQTHEAGTTPPVEAGPAPGWRSRGVAKAPTDASFQNAAKWTFTLPAAVADDLSELFLEVSYQGDVARLNRAGKLLEDDFYSGKPWVIGLKRFLRPQANPFELSILPLRKDAPVYFELPNLMAFPSTGQVDKLDGLTLVPEYQLVLTMNGLN